MFKDDISGAVGMVILIFLALTLGNQIKGCSSEAEAEEKKVAEVIPGKLKTWIQDWEKGGEKFKSSGDGIKAGKWWCLGKNSKCTKNIPKRLRKRMDTYGPWFKEYAGGMIPTHLALISCTEAPSGPGQCSSDSKLKECGLMGTKWQMAKKYNINVCDPQAAIAGAAAAANARRMAVIKKYPQLKMAPAMDRYIIGGLAGGIGGLSTMIIKGSNALKVVTRNGTEQLLYPKPYSRILAWMASPKIKPKTLVERIQVGRITKYKVGFRIARPYAVIQILMNYHGVDSFEDISRGKLQKVSIPDYLPEYPGDKLHGRCYKFPELLTHLPD